LSLAIGKEGQNARLAARLSGYKVDIHPDKTTEQVEAEAAAALEAAAEVEAEAAAESEIAADAGEPVEPVDVDTVELDVVETAPDDEDAVEEAVSDDTDDESE
jgi:N utilization substance protein A